MDLSQQISQLPKLDALLRRILRDHSGRDEYRFRLTQPRLRDIGIGSTLDESEEWLQRLALLAQHDVFEVRPAPDERLLGTDLVVYQRHRQRLIELLADPNREFPARWPSLVADSTLPEPFAEWLLGNPPHPSWAAQKSVNWALALQRLTTLDKGKEYSGQQLGAYLFGDAKLTENSNRARDWLVNLGSVCGWQLVERGLLLHAHLPSGVSHIALIENQDTYLRLVDTCGERLGLIFVAGNRSASQRLLSRTQCYFGYTVGSDPEAIERFEAFWFEGDAGDYDLRYWGDLDSEGLAILIRMQKLLPGLKPWLAAYRAMASLKSMSCAAAIEAEQLANLLTGGDVHQEAVLNLNQLEWD